MNVNSLVNIAIVGLGRLGKHHAENLAFRVRGVRLVAACSIVAEELEYAKTVLGVERTYGQYEELLAQEKALDGVFLATASAGHPEQIIAALENGYHVFCEKPLALTVKDGLRVHAVHAQHAQQIVALGFMRRYDPSHVYVRELIDRGELGRPFLVRSQTVDKYTMAPFQLEFIRKGSGSIFMDYNVHDIDIARWFCGGNVTEVYALGGAYGIKEFAELGDADNTTALLKFDNEAMANVSAFRIAPHGAAMFTEVLGTKKWLAISFIPARNRVQVADEHGVRFECVENFYEHFEKAFLAEAQDYVDCIRTGKQPRASISDGIYATQCAVALSDSFKRRERVQLTPLTF